MFDEVVTTQHRHYFHVKQMLEWPFCCCFFYQCLAFQCFVNHQSRDSIALGGSRVRLIAATISSTKPGPRPVQTSYHTDECETLKFKPSSPAVTLGRGLFWRTPGRWRWEESRGWAGRGCGGELNQPSPPELPRGASPGRTVGNSGTAAGSGTGPVVRQRGQRKPQILDQDGCQQTALSHPWLKVSTNTKRK